MTFPAPLRTLSAFFFGAEVVVADMDGIDEHGQRRIRAAQIATAVELVPMSMSINILNALIVVFVFRDAAPLQFLIPWALMVVLAVGVSLWSWWRSRHKKITGASARSIRRMVWHSGLLGATWGILPLVLFPSAGLPHQMIIACLTTGMISGGAFGLWTVPRAALISTWSIVLGAKLSRRLREQETDCILGTRCRFDHPSVAPLRFFGLHPIA